MMQEQSNKQRVAITGIGLITPLGNDVSSNWNNLINGKSGISLLQNPELAQYPYNIAGQIKDEQELIDRIVPANKKRKTARFIHLALVAADQALQDAGCTANIPERRDRFGTCVGVGIGGVDAITQASLAFQDTGARRVSPFLIPKAIINQAGAHISMMHNLQGPMSAIVNACSSSGDAVGFGFRMIRDGYADYMVAGGTESCIMPLSVAAFGNMRSLALWKGDPQ